MTKKTKQQEMLYYQNVLKHGKFLVKCNNLQIVYNNKPSGSLPLKVYA